MSLYVFGKYTHKRLYTCYLLCKYRIYFSYARQSQKNKNAVGRRIYNIHRAGAGMLIMFTATEEIRKSKMDHNNENGTIQWEKLNKGNKI